MYKEVKTLKLWLLQFFILSSLLCPNILLAALLSVTEK